jgi:hypothetical protein
VSHCQSDSERFGTLNIFELSTSKNQFTISSTEALPAPSALWHAVVVSTPPSSSNSVHRTR